MEPTDPSRARDRDQSLEFRAWNSNSRLETRSLHETTPLGPMRSDGSAESLVHGGMGEFVANDFLQQRRWAVEEEISDSNLPRPRIIEAKGNAHS